MPRVVIDRAVADGASLDNEIARLRGLDVGELRARWHTMFRRVAPPHLPRHLLFRILVPGPRSRASGHRGAAASWHGSGAPRRHARRVVSAAPDARTSFGVTGIRTESLPLAVSISGKRDFGAREKCAETTCRL